MSTTTAPREIRDAATHVCVTVALGVVVLIAAMSTSGGLNEFFILAAPSVVILGTLAAMVRTYLNWKSGGRWQIWQGATWFLLALSLLWFTGALPSVIVD
ncbi:MULTISPECIES: hypothetical protein [Gordonia]|uniref:Transmembrane protein n=2 Tax=Gordonia TaxID=2053 RepID=L7LFN4_9ACTN|nr:MULTISPECIES: hypothetical protein [Gordonia]AUH69770.1 hypothetical protein CXX93_17485 [Gordonia sp. YC-JH1]KJR08777.1 hypothetical protein UG54_06620 [Gordonia sihwensis]KXT56442.1 hypothetical protein Y710_13225 [Gordonia sp. QH-12]MBY4571515.1 hypothetical protein [Gordonia sihwensis]GAC59531.1 hypothetical protein GSI01S_02_01740 [Gordonia sihwensis NBRC 108236]